MKILVSTLMLTAIAAAGQNRVWTVRVIERSPTTAKRESKPSPTPVKVTPKLLRSMLDHSESMSDVAAKYGTSIHGRQAVVNAHQSFRAAVKAKESDTRLRAKYQAVVSHYEQWLQKDLSQTVTDRYGNPLNR